MASIRRFGAIAMTMLIGAIASGALDKTNPGPWKARITISSGTVGSNLTDFIVAVRLSDMPATFWERVRPDGGDLEVKTTGGTNVPRHLFRFDYTENEGWLFFKGTLLSASDNEWDIHYGNRSIAPFVQSITNSLTITNPGADVDVSGWTATTGSLGRRTSNPAPFEGAGYFFAGPNAETRAHQDISIPMAEETDVDNGLRQARLQWYQTSFNGSDEGEMEIEFFNGAMASLGSRIGSGLTAPLGQEWNLRRLNLLIPSTTRTIRISMHAVRSAGTNNDAYFDAITLDIADLEENGKEQVWSDYEMVALMGSDGNIDAARRTRGAVLGDPDMFEQLSVSANRGVHQGVCSDNIFNYLVDDNLIKKYDGNTLVLENTDPIGDSGLATVDHLGDPEYFAGLLYIPLEEFTGGGSTTEHIAIYNAKDLTFVQAFDISAQNHEVSSIAYVPEDGLLYITSFFDDRNIFKYDPVDGSFIGTLELSSPIADIQGITYYKGRLYINADGPDETYICDLNGDVRGSGIFGQAVGGGNYEGIGKRDDNLLILTDPTGSSDGVVRTFSPQNIDNSAGGGIDIQATATLLMDQLKDASTYTLGCTLVIDDKSVNRVAASYLDEDDAPANNTRQIIGYRNSASRIAIWDVNNSWLNSSVDPTIGVAYRVHAVYDGSTDRIVYVDGSQSGQEIGITAIPSSFNAVRIGTEDGDENEDWQGQVGFCYLRFEELSADWISAEYDNLSSPATFYSIGTEQLA
jgi:hypothetical protein